MFIYFPSLDIHYIIYRLSLGLTNLTYLNLCNIAENSFQYSYAIYAYTILWRLLRRSLIKMLYSNILSINYIDIFTIQESFLYISITVIIFVITYIIIVNALHQGHEALDIYFFQIM